MNAVSLWVAVFFSPSACVASAPLRDLFFFFFFLLQTFICLVFIHNFTNINQKKKKKIKSCQYK